MNVKLQYHIAFNAGAWFDNELTMATYQVRLKFLTQTIDPADQNIALERVKHFLLEEIHSTIFINQAEIETAEYLAEVGINVTTLPEEPADQVVSIMLYHKLNAVMEGRMKITELVLSSDAGDNIEYYQSSTDQTGLFVDMGWWNESTLRHNDFVNEEDDKPVVVMELDEWKDRDLAWSQPEVTTDVNQIVFADLNHNETKH